MADVELASSAPDSGVFLVSVPASHDTPSDTHEEHEASDVVDQDPNVHAEPEIVHNIADVETPLGEIVKGIDGDQDVFTAPGPPPAVGVSANKADVHSKGATPASKEKSTVLAKPVSGKVNSSTPTHKKVR